VHNVWPTRHIHLSCYIQKKTLKIWHCSYTVLHLLLVPRYILSSIYLHFQVETHHWSPKKYTVYYYLTLVTSCNSILYSSHLWWLQYNVMLFVAERGCGQLLYVEPAAQCTEWYWAVSVHWLCTVLVTLITDNTYNRHQAKRPHYASTQRAPLASRASACRLQAGGAGLQSTSWSDGAVPRRRLSTHRFQRRLSQVAVGGHWHLHRSSNKHATRWQKLFGRWSTAMEQSPSRTASARHRTGGISTATENFCLCDTSALSDFCFRAPYKYSATTTTVCCRVFLAGTWWRVASRCLMMIRMLYHVWVSIVWQHI